MSTKSPFLLDQQALLFYNRNWDPMKSTRFAIALSLSLLAWSVLGAATPQMKVEDIRPGMVGVGRTVFDGTNVEEFQAHIIGVIENVIGTQRNLILARLEGGPLANTGVIAGMSGQPGLHRRTADRGRVLLARQLLQGADCRHHANRRDDRRHSRGDAAAGRGPGARRTAAHARGSRSRLPQGAHWNRPFADRASDAQLIGVRKRRRSSAAEIGTMLRPIATPLVMSGFDGRAWATLEWRRSAMRASSPTGAARCRPLGEMAEFDGPLKPGDAVGVTFVSGDLGARRNRHGHAHRRRSASTRSGTRCTTSARPSSR